MNGQVLTGVSGHFSAAHRDPETGSLHGHTWLVKVWFSTPHHADARLFKTAVENMLALWDHTTLPDELAWGEDIARALGVLPNVVEVEVSRPAEGYFAKWIAT